MSNPFEQSDYDQSSGGGGGAGGGYQPPQQEYNPFSGGGGGASANTTATTSSSFKPTSTPGAGASSDDVRMKEAALAKRAAELDERERQLKKREAEMGASGYRPPNWPVCKPFLYHDIKEEVPSELQGMVRACYFNWIGYAAAMGLNWFCVMCYFFSVQYKQTKWFHCSMFSVVIRAFFGLDDVL